MTAGDVPRTRCPITFIGSMSKQHAARIYQQCRHTMMERRARSGDCRFEQDWLHIPQGSQLRQECRLPHRGEVNDAPANSEDSRMPHDRWGSITVVRLGMVVVRDRAGGPGEPHVLPNMVWPPSGTG